MLLDRISIINAKLMARTIFIDRGFTCPCWEWTGPTSGTGRGGGYGRFCLDGQTVAVHIVGYTNHHGYIPSKKQVDHLCNNRLCWNPAHLELVTHKQNQRRRDKRRAQAND